MDILHVLPLEIVSSVISNIHDLPTLLSLRLTCKALLTCATPLAFHNVHIWLDKTSLLRLNEIAKTPHLARHVKHISCGMEEFYDVDIEAFLRFTYNQFHPPHSSKAKSPEYFDINASHTLYRRYLELQTCMRHAREDLELLTQAFCLFPAMDSIAVTDSYADRYYVEPDACEIRIIKQEPLLRAYMLGPNRLLSPRGGHKLRTIVRAVAKAKVQVRHFALALSSRYRGGRSGPLLPFDAEEQQAAWRAFGTLKTFYMEGAAEMDESSYEKEGLQVLSVTTMLQAAKNLEKLSLLDYHEVVCVNPIAAASLESLMGATKFEKLRELYLRKLVVTEGELGFFISQSCTGLRILRIHSARLIDGTWASLFKTIRQSLSLETVDLYRLQYNYEDDPESFTTMLSNGEPMGDLHDYLCKITNVDPWPEMIKEDFRIVDEQDREDEKRMRKLDASSGEPLAPREAERGL